MAKYTIKELHDYWKENVTNKTFLFSNYYDAPVGTDTRPAWVKPYVDNDTSSNYIFDDYVAERYAEWSLMYDCDTVANAYQKFLNSNGVYGLTHTTELNMIHKAFTTDFNPLENYDRLESSQTDVDASSGANSKVAPDNAETFYNTGSAESTSDSTTVVSSRVHGNIGVTQATDMLRNTVEYFNDNAYINVLIDRIISDSCYMIDNGIDII